MLELCNMFPIRLPNITWQSINGVTNQDLTSIEKSISNIAQLVLLNAATMGRSISLDWNTNRLCTWQRFWSEANFTGNLLKQIDYVWNSDSLVTTETYTFYDYSDTDTLLRTRRCVVTYTWNSLKLCTGIDVGVITTL